MKRKFTKIYNKVTVFYQKDCKYMKLSKSVVLPLDIIYFHLKIIYYLNQLFIYDYQ